MLQFSESSAQLRQSPIFASIYDIIQTYELTTTQRADPAIARLESDQESRPKTGHLASCLVVYLPQFRRDSDIILNSAAGLNAPIIPHLVDFHNALVPNFCCTKDLPRPTSFIISLSLHSSYLITVRNYPNVAGHSFSNSIKNFLIATNQPSGAHGAGTGRSASTVGSDAGNIITKTAAKIHV